MRRSAFILLLFFRSTYSIGQSIAENEKIIAFKNDFLTNVGLYKPDTLRVENLMLIREKYPNVRIVKTFQESKNTVIYEYYYNGTKQLESTLIYDTLKQPFGIKKQYTKEGKLEYTQDYDNGEWVVYDTAAYPFYNLQNIMKIKADSLISKMYGHSFLSNNVIWNIGGSYIYNDKESGNWTDKFKNKPNKFLFRYDVKLDDDHKYERLIEFELDKNSTYLPSQYEEVFGFENVPDNLKGSFKLKYSDALTKAVSLGLIENDTTKAVGILRWENFKSLNIINGQFRFYFIVKTKTIKNLVPNGRSSRTTKFEIYSFNPWTGDFIEKKKMKSIYSWEQMSGSSTGLIPDTD